MAIRTPDAVAPSSTPEADQAVKRVEPAQSTPLRLPFVQPDRMISSSPVAPSEAPASMAESQPPESGYVRPENMLIALPADIPRAPVKAAPGARLEDAFPVDVAGGGPSILDFFRTRMDPVPASPRDADALARAIYFATEADNRMLAGQLDEAMEFYRMALEIFPQMTYANWQVGRISIAQRRYPDAIRYLTEAVRNTTDLGETLNDLGIAYLYAGDLDQALAIFSSAAAADPSLLDPPFNLGLTLLRAGRIKDARIQFKEYSVLAPEDPRPHRELAMLEIMERRPVAAGAFLERAITIDPDWPQPLLDAALLQAESGDLDVAMDYLTRALGKADPREVIRVYRQAAFNPVRLSPRGDAFEAQLAERARRLTAPGR
jgi:Flp pilus assembly protein TadD